MVEEVAKEGFTRYKAYYLLFMFFIYLVMFWAYIDASHNNLPIVSALQFYIMFGAFLGLAPIIFDMLTVKRFVEVKTITIEKPRVSWFGLRFQLVLAIIIAITLGWRIMVTGTAFIPYPTYQIFEGQLASSIMNGIFGIVEDWVWFAFIFPTTLFLLTKFLKNELFALPPALLIEAVAFMLYHVFVYSTAAPALMAVFIYAIISSICVYSFQSLIISNTLHLTNNLVASYIKAAIWLSF